MSTWAVSASGTQTATINTEHTLVTDNSNATFYFQVSLANFAVADVLVLRCYLQTLAGDPYEVAWKHVIATTLPAEIVFCSAGQPSDQGVRYTLQQTAGTGRAFRWKVLRQ